MTLKLYNTLTKQEEEFTPINGKKVNMYVCGVTPYDHCHIGHARCYVAFDIIRRYLEYKGYDLNYIQNFTDIDDKIIKKANDEKTDCETISERYIADFFKGMDALNIKRAHKNPKVTENIGKIIGAVKKLIDKGFAYELDGDVYFRVKSFATYGKLSGRDLEEMQSGARVAVNDDKENPMDFALWKKAKENEPFWPSPWGKGRPGWHIECSVLSIDNLGETIDIHGGGADLIFPHHENEIAQSEALTGKQFSKYWMHNGFVMINKEKMSKSLGNFFTLADVLEKYDPMVLRLFLLTNHYRRPLDFSDDKLEENKKRFEKFIIFKERIKNINTNIRSENTPEILEFEKEFETAMDNDFNTAVAIAVLHKLLEYGNKRIESEPNKAKAAADKISDLGKILGIKFEYKRQINLEADKIHEDLTKVVLSLITQKEELPSEIKKILSEREEARKNKNWQESDRLRDVLKEQGYEIKDTKNGTEIWKI